MPITIKDIEPKTNLFNKYYKENPQLFLNDENENNNMIISLIEVGDDYPCMNYTEKVWVTYDGNDRNNVTSCSDIGGKKLDDRFIHIEGFKIDKVDFYKNNGLEDYISIGLKETPIPVNLYGRVLFGLYYNDETINYERMCKYIWKSNTHHYNCNDDCIRNSFCYSWLLFVCRWSCWGR